MNLLVAIFSDRFPIGAFTVAAFILLARGAHELGLVVLIATAQWRYLEHAVLAYGTRDGQPVVNALRLLLLVVLWGLFVSAIYLIGTR